MRINGKFVNKTITSEVSEKKPGKINLDVTAMMAYCSSLTSECNDATFREPILTDQAKREKLCSTKTFLVKLFQGKSLITVQKLKHLTMFFCY